MADHPLRSATHRRLGGPLPHQLANGTRAHLCPSRLLPLPDAGPWSYAVLAPISKCYPPDRGRLLTRYSPVRHYAYFYAPFDLHVLSTPPAFVLSQNQTLMLFFDSSSSCSCIPQSHASDESFQTGFLLPYFSVPYGTVRFFFSLKTSLTVVSCVC